MNKHQEFNLATVEDSLGYRFKNADLLDLALTHSSWANERRTGDMHNERLEFLGDAVLELCVSTELYRRFPKAREGDLTRLRSRLVNAESLARHARAAGLAKALKLGVGEERQGGRNRDSVLSDAFEAVLAAIFEDGGLPAAQDFIGRVFVNSWPGEWHEEKTLDNKSRLQEISQHIFRDCPVYTLVGASGPEHAKTFSVCLHLPNGQRFYAANSSCKKAEQDAAAQALVALEKMTQ